jgi:hypothetical protein
MLTTHRSYWLLAALSATTAIAMFATPLALADDDHHDRHGDRDDHRQQVVQVQVRDQDREDEDEDVDAVNMDAAQMARANALVNAVTNEVTVLSNMDFDKDQDVDVLDIDHVRKVSLSTLETGLTTTEAGSVTTAVNANAAALQTFLNGGSANATAIDTALSNAGITTSSAMAILLRGDGNLIVITS